VRCRQKKLGVWADATEVWVKDSIRLRRISATVVVLFSLAMARASAAATDMPNSKLTPGAIATENAQTVCRAGYSRSIRPKNALWRKLKDAAYNRYGLARGQRSEIDAAGRRHAAYTIDHLAPLELGGSPDDIRNLWPQPRAAAKRKDEVENELHDLVCTGQMRLKDAQRAIEHNWKIAVPESLHERRPAPKARSSAGKTT
jgi:hypothetical protein